MRCSQKRLGLYHHTSNTDMEIGITTLTPTLDPSQACMSSHTSKPSPSSTKNQQSHQNYELNLEHKLRAIHILCVHHKNMPIGSKEYTQQMNDNANTLQILAMFNQATPPTPIVITVYRNREWIKLTYPPLPSPPLDHANPRYPTNDP